MGITLKTNRIGIIKVIMPLFIVLTIFFTLLIIAYLTHYEDMKNQTLACIVISSLEVFSIICISCTKFVCRKIYTFTPEQITVCYKKKQINQIDIDNIVFMKYNSFHARYIFTMLCGEVLDGGCWKLYINLANGNRIFLDIFDTKDIIKIKELYGGLVQII